MKLSAILEPLVAAGVDAETILKAVKAWEDQQTDALERRRANDRERQERRRHVKSRDVTVTVSSRARVEGSSSKKDITGEDKEDTGAAKPRGVSDLDAFKAELSSILDAERIDALVAVRRKKGATITANTGRLLATAIKRCPLDPAEVADEMALRNWTSVKPAWLDGQKQHDPPPKPKKTTQANMWADDAIAIGIADDPSSQVRHDNARHLRGPDQGPGLARRFASA